MRVEISFTEMFLTELTPSEQAPRAAGACFVTNSEIKSEVDYKVPAQALLNWHYTVYMSFFYFVIFLTNLYKKLTS